MATVWFFRRENAAIPGESPEAALVGRQRNLGRGYGDRETFLLLKE
jgi:hypothetical protein